jgi:hypothetical protein
VVPPANERAFSGEPMRAERAARVRCNAMLDGVHLEIDEHVDADGRLEHSCDKEPLRIPPPDEKTCSNDAPDRDLRAA